MCSVRQPIEVFYCRLVLVSMVGLVSLLPTFLLARHVWNKNQSFKGYKGAGKKKRKKKITSTLHSDHPSSFLGQP